MRTNNDVLAVVLEDVASFLSHTCTEVKECVVATDSGIYKNVARDFLVRGASTTTISRGALKTSYKRKCCVIKLSCLPPDLQAQLKKGIMYLHSSIISSSILAKLVAYLNNILLHNTHVYI